MGRSVLISEVKPAPSILAFTKLVKFCPTWISLKNCVSGKLIPALNGFKLHFTVNTWFCLRNAFVEKTLSEWSTFSILFAKSSWVELREPLLVLNCLLKRTEIEEIQLFHAGWPATHESEPSHIYKNGFLKSIPRSLKITYFGVLLLIVIQYCSVIITVLLLLVLCRAPAHLGSLQQFSEQTLVSPFDRWGNSTLES